MGNKKQKQTKQRKANKNENKKQRKKYGVNKFSKFSLRPQSHLKLLISIENNKNLCMRSNVGGDELTRDNPPKLFEFRFLSNIDRLISRN